MPPRPRTGGGRLPQSWATFLHNHAGAVLACDFFLVVTAAFQRRYVFVVLDITTRRVVHWKSYRTPHGQLDDPAVSQRPPLDGAYGRRFRDDPFSYDATLLREEGRPVTFRLALSEPGLFDDAAGPPSGLHRLVFARPLPLDQHELRRLAPAAAFSPQRGKMSRLEHQHAAPGDNVFTTDASQPPVPDEGS